VTQHADPRIPVDPVIEAYKKDVDRTLIRENLKLTVQQRFEQLMDLQRFAEELRRAGRRARSGRAAGRPKDLEAIAELEAILDERERFET
jgi:hypothetical protein